MAASEPTPAIDRLHITVCAMSTGEDPLDLSHELRLTKAAVLYADEVTLAGPKVQMLAHLQRFRVASAADQEQIVRRMASVLSEGADALERIDRVVRARGGFASVRARQLRDRLLRDARQQVAAQVESLLEQARYAEFDQAHKARALAFEPLFGGAGGRLSETADLFVDVLQKAARAQGLSTTSLTAAGWSTEFQERMTALLVRLLGPDSASEPLFDDATGGLVRALANLARAAGQRTPAIAKEPALAAGLMGTVPAYADAPMSEILDARKALREALVRFRAAVSKFSTQIVQIPPGAAFDREVKTLYRQEVAPALLDLDEVQRELRLDRELMRHSLRDGKDLLTGLLAFTVVQRLEVDALLQALAGVAPVAARVVQDVREGRRIAGERRRANRFLFLYELGHRFGDRRS